MNQSRSEARVAVARPLTKASEIEERVRKALNERRTVVRYISEERLTIGQRIADIVAEFGGSWTFIIMFMAAMAAWMVLNSGLLGPQAFDPYPYILLNLLLSTLAALQAPVIMMSQNRQAAKDRARSEHEYEINLKAELEVGQIHRKLDEFRDVQWTRLVEMQQRQIAHLERLVNSLHEPDKA
jgi:uncharacterized membrane protein